MIGVYVIECTANGKVYIGSSRDIHRRWIGHRTYLRHGNGSAKLQASWNKYGEEAFRFSVLEELSSIETLAEREQAWIDAMEPELNVSLVVGSIPSTNQKLDHVERRIAPIRGIKRSEEFAENCRRRALLWWSDPENRALRRPPSRSSKRSASIREARARGTHDSMKSPHRPAVARLHSEGLLDREIASSLGITVKSVRGLRHKMGLKKRGGRPRYVTGT